MKISDNIRKKYATAPDPESDFFLDHFDAEPDSTVLEVGSHDAPIASMLAEAGFTTVGVDLRPYDHQPQKHWHLVGDFCDMPNGFWDRWRRKFDVVVSVSAIEHFGLGTYGDRGARQYLDIIAARLMWDCLKDGGTCWLQVPIGSTFVTIGSHWRVYSWASVQERLVQDFQIEERVIRVCEEFYDNYYGRTYPVGTYLNDPPVMPRCLGAGFPGVSVLVKMRKVSRKV